MAKQCKLRPRLSQRFYFRYEIFQTFAFTHLSMSWQDQLYFSFCSKLLQPFVSILNIVTFWTDFFLTLFEFNVTILIFINLWTLLAICLQLLPGYLLCRWCDVEGISLIKHSLGSGLFNFKYLLLPINMFHCQSSSIPTYGTE